MRVKILIVTIEFNCFILVFSFLYKYFYVLSDEIELRFGFFWVKRRGVFNNILNQKNI